MRLRGEDRGRAGRGLGAGAQADRHEQAQRKAAEAAAAAIADEREHTRREAQDDLATHRQELGGLREELRAARREDNDRAEAPSNEARQAEAGATAGGHGERHARTAGDAIDEVIDRPESARRARSERRSATRRGRSACAA